MLTPQDKRDLNAGEKRVCDLMTDGKWHGADEIRIAAGTDGMPASEGLRRLRALRKDFDIEKRRVNDSRFYEYRLVIPEPKPQPDQQPKLFEDAPPRIW